MKIRQLINYFNLLKKRQIVLGFSLIELLAASSITSVVIGSCGFGLVAMVRKNLLSNVRSQILYDVDRASEFISNEIRPAQKIEKNATAALTNAPNFTLPTDAKPILALQLPNVPQRIIYYTLSASSPWIGPKIVYRWGPPLNEKGEYAASTLNTPANWKSEALIDLIDNTPITPTCPTGWQSSQTNPVQGFYACINPGEKLAQFNLGAVVKLPTETPIAYQVKTIVFARVTTPSSDNTPGFQIVNNQLKLNDPAKISYQVLGGAITCGAGGSVIPVSTSLKVNSTTYNLTPNQPLSVNSLNAGTTIDIESIANSPSCNNHYMKVSSTDVNSKQLTVLKNGDSVPNITPFANQTSIDQFLKNYIENGKIKLANNQAIYLFELGATYDNSKPSNQQTATFDMQDNVVLATINNP